MHARAILDFEGIAKNATGELSIQGDALVFESSQARIARITLGSIQSASLSQEDKQVGGTSMALGRAATPFGGGRVIGLFAHKMYGFLTLEYADSNGGIHGAIYQLNKEQAPALGHELTAKGVHISEPNVDAANRRDRGTNNESK